jgi:hypothetical protein
MKINAVKNPCIYKWLVISGSRLESPELKAHAKMRIAYEGLYP